MLCFGSNLIETYLSLVERLTKTFSYDFIYIRTWLSLGSEATAACGGVKGAERVAAVDS